LGGSQLIVALPYSPFGFLFFGKPKKRVRSSPNVFVSRQKATLGIVFRHPFVPNTSPLATPFLSGYAVQDVLYGGYKRVVVTLQVLCSAATTAL